MTERRATIRLDKWLWYARFFKSRTLSGKVVTAGHVRINRVKVSRAASPVGVGDTLTFAQGRNIRVVRIKALGTRRGPALEAQALYEDLSPPTKTSAPAPRFDGKGRPGKKDRRQMARQEQRDSNWKE
ncbi:MAG: RNA-binding S4 domain-containing protein [Paracoccaceae bacterium]|nr:RNA-binding S4 domain-containing protein [Paracoccaceae bacterium]